MVTGGTMDDKTFRGSQMLKYVKQIVLNLGSGKYGEIRLADN